MAAEICENSKDSDLEFRAKGFFESRGWSLSSSRASARRSSSSPPMSISHPTPVDHTDITLGGDPSPSDCNELFGRVWLQSPNPGEPFPRETPSHGPKPSSFRRRYGFKRGGGNDGQKNLAVPPLEQGVLSEIKESEEVSEEFTNVSVGEGNGKRVQYRIRKDILQHHLLQVLMKCSNDDRSSKNESVGSCVPISCDPALFLQLVRVVGGNSITEILKK